MKDYKIKDYIEERNKKQKMANSIVKRRNIVYTPIQEQAEDRSTLEAPNGEREQAAQILQALKENSQANKVLKQVQESPEALALSPDEINELLKDR